MKLKVISENLARIKKSLGQIAYDKLGPMSGYVGFHDHSKEHIAHYDKLIQEINEEYENQNNDIPAKDLKEGQFAVITQWGDTPKYIGELVIRYKEDLICLSRFDEKSAKWTNWSQIFFIIGNKDADFIDSRPNEFRVNVLPKGTKFEIE